MKILVVSNLYPPVSPGVGEWRCQSITEALQLRGHEVRVLTSNFGISRGERGEQVERRLLLNGAFGQPAVTEFKALRALEIHNQQVLREAVRDFAPDLCFVWSLRGLSKGLIFTLNQLRRPVVYDVADDWMITDLRRDPWFKWWNSEKLPLTERVRRHALELTGERVRLDELAPTRPGAETVRLPDLFDGDAQTPLQPGALDVFPFARMYFCSEYLRRTVGDAGLRVDMAAIIRPGVATELFFAEPRPAAQPPRRLLVCTPLVRESGVLTALAALKEVCAGGLKLQLTVCGKGASEHVAQLRSYVVEHRLPVEFVNHGPRSRDLLHCFRDADVFLHTEEWPEPCVITPLEAMASGQAVIGSTAGGGLEIFRHRKNALAYAPGNVAELAECLRAVVLIPGLRRVIAETGQSEVIARYNEITSADQIENFLKESLALWREE